MEEGESDEEQEQEAAGELEGENEEQAGGLGSRNVAPGTQLRAPVEQRWQEQEPQHWERLLPKLE